jgi:cell division protein FtsW
MRWGAEITKSTDTAAPAAKAVRIQRMGLALGVWLGRVAGRIRTLKDALWPSAVAVVVPVLFGGAEITKSTDTAAPAAKAVRIQRMGMPAKNTAARFFVISAPHRMERVTSWLTGDCDPSAGCYQAMHGLSALARRP